MALSNYSDLVAAVKDWSNRNDSSVSNRAADFVRLGELRIWRTVRSMWGISDPTTLTVNAGSNFVALPTDWLGFDSIGTDRFPTIELMGYDALTLLPKPGRSDVFAIRGPNLFIGQMQDANLPISCTYYKHPGFLGDSLPTTWLLARAPDLYLYAALIEAAIYMKKTDKAGEFGQLYEAARTLYMSAERGDLYRGQRLRLRRG